MILKQSRYQGWHLLRDFLKSPANHKQIAKAVLRKPEVLLWREHRISLRLLRARETFSPAKDTERLPLRSSSSVKWWEAIFLCIYIRACTSKIIELSILARKTFLFCWDDEWRWNFLTLHAIPAALHRRLWGRVAWKMMNGNRFQFVLRHRSSSSL